MTSSKPTKQTKTKKMTTQHKSRGNQHHNHEINLPCDISYRIKDIYEKYGTHCTRNSSTREIKYFILDC